MDRTLAEHIQSLEEKRDLLSGRLMQERSKAKRNQLESELRAVESALWLYRSALEIEQGLAPASLNRKPIVRSRIAHRRNSQ